MLCQQVLMEYVDILQTQIETLEKAGTANVSSSAIPYQINNGFTFQNRSDKVSQSVQISDELKNERNTWRLLFELRELSIQKKDDLTILSTAQLPVTNQSTEMDAIAALENRHQIFALQKTILKWLEHVATESVVATKEKRQMHLRTLKQLKRKTSGQSFAMDPDGPLREGDNYLDDDDVEDELDLLKSVWQLLRAGKTHEAMDLCIQLGQPWRVASLSGGEISGACDNESGISRWGNPYRMLWKKMCWQFAESPAPGNLHNTNSLEAREYDSIIYAALSGHAQVILESPHCNSWEDHCWALIKAVIAFQEDDAIFHLLNLKAQTTSLILENSPDHMQLYKAFLAQVRPVVGRFCTNIDQLFEELAASANEVVRAQAQHPHRRIQAKLVTSRIDNIVQDILAALLGPLSGPFTWDLELNDNIPADTVSPQLLRFGAHFVLFMKTTGESFDEEAGARLLKAYIRHLVKHAQYKLVALYAGQLPEEGRGEIYSQCLITIPRHEERQQCLAAIAPFCPPALFAQVTRAAAETLMASKTDARRIGALSLLTFDEKHRVEAVYQANILARQFIAEDKQVRLKALFAQLPEDSLSIIHQQSSKEDKMTADTIREHLAWKALIGATEAYESWRASLPTKRTAACFSDEETIVKEVLFRASVATHAITDVLEFEHGWLMEVPTVRSKCLPFLVFHAHRVQLETVAFLEGLEFYPSEAKEALQAPLAQNAMNLADIVADEHYLVYRAFSQDQTRHLLHLLQQSAMYLL
ncbi:hypothetical protein THRCLA_10355 [Thraustotheca clavata]|uniref:Nuclear pore complex protein n=1 Tax=Thraustotheca clavata TaxID=74557 RepID=A0A1V9YRJ6_9STRA|nr:hypothetical protein THRCLA_10355 [Thraustotheca clavata]